MDVVGSLQRVWDAQAEANTLRSILGVRETGEPWTLDQFFESGVHEIEAVLARYSSGPSRALDFGCGIGRITQALARRFELAWGVDVSPRMVELASAHNRAGDRCRYSVNAQPDLGIFDDGYFDLVWSQITLQHIPPAAASYISEFFRVVRPGGLVMFQLPARRHARTLRERAQAALLRFVPGALLRRLGVVEVHGMERARVEKIIALAGGSLLAVEVDHSLGDAWLSYRYVATKNGASR
ncbi:MAG TPA: class I SAM-dependent methyltransferase [Bryobacteraceae bacterium]|nr:class I SAM-dependent methyltransferase [Bryobacteraceae bacterium]